MPQIEALAERGAQRYRDFLDERLGESAYVALDTFSVADITALVTIEFARRALNTAPGAEHEHIARWQAGFSRRPGGGA